MPSHRRPATPQEAKALANPMRIRILRLCLDRSRTNKELADHLGRDPGTVLHHVRVLVDTGFLAPEAAREGASGALEKPYRATGKSWNLSLDDTSTAVPALLAMVDAFRAELAECLAAGGTVTGATRLVVRLDEAGAAELAARLQDLAEEFLERQAPDGEPYGVLLIAHDRAGGEPTAAGTPT